MADEHTDEITEDDKTELLDAPAEPKTKLGIGLSLMLALATVVTLLGFLALWADRQVLNTDQWTETSTELLESPAVQDALANYLVDQLFNNLDVQGELAQELPPELAGLAGPISGGLRQLALKAAESALEKPAVQQAWKTANRAAHKNLIVILDGGNEQISTANGEVTVNTKLLLTDIAKQIGIPQSLVNKLPPQVGQLTVMKSDQLQTAQNASKAIKGMAWIFTILAVLLYASVIYLAAGRRRRAVAWVGISFASVGLLILLIQGLGRTPVVDSLASTSAVVPAVTDVYNTSTELLKAMATSVFVSGLLVIFASFLAGPSKFSVGFRRGVAPFMNHYLAGAAAFAILLFLLVVWWAPTHGFRTAGGLFLNLLLAVSGFAALAVMTRREFPEAEAPDFSHAGDWFRERWQDTESFFDRQTDRFERSPKADKAEGDLAELDHLQSLRERGALSDEEFEAQKRKLLGE